MAKASVKVKVRLFAQFLSQSPGERVNRESWISLPDRSTVGHLIEKLGISQEIPKIVLINGVHKDLNDELSDGDVVSIFPPLGGG